MSKHSYKTSGVCSRQIEIELDGDIIKSVEFEGGCSGNLQGVAILANGMNARDYIEKCKGIKCGSRPTSCPAQLAKALEVAINS